MDILNILKNNQAYLNDFKIRTIKHSNAIEGSNITIKETKEIIINANTNINKSTRFINDTINLNLATDEMLLQLLNKESFSPDIAIYLNKIILGKAIKQTHYYRTTQVMIKGSKFAPPFPFELPNLMNCLFNKYEKLFNNHVDLEDLAKFHIEFEKIHPFIDGNGRTGRLLINFCLIKDNQIPIDIPDQKRSKYIDFLETEDYKGFAKFIKELQAEEKLRIKFFDKQ